MRTALFPAIMAAVLIASPALAQSAPPHLPSDLSPEGVRAADEHLALEQVSGPEAIAFVAAANEKSLAVLTKDPRYETFRAEAEAILTSAERIPAPMFLGEGIGNFWQDGQHPKGLLRRTTLQSYRSAAPAWETLLDVDALARTEGRDWVFKGVSCLPPDDVRCLVSLSDGGKDAVVVREFDVASRAFVDRGFVVAEGKHRTAWLDEDTLLVASDFGAGTLTESGYPYIVRALKRGQALAAAAEVFRGDQGDGGYGVTPSVYRDGSGRVLAVIFHRPLDTYRTETWLLVDGRPVKLALPERVRVHGVSGEALILTLDEPWTLLGRTFPAGALMSPSLASLTLSLDDVAAGDRAIEVFTPGERQSIQDVRVLDGRLIVALSDNVVGKLARFEDRGERGWARIDIATPVNASVVLGDGSKESGRVFVTTEGFLDPPALGLLDGDAASLVPLRAMPAQFDASTHVVEQFEATSTDGARIPYFVVRPKDQSGPAPTILYGYGGFQIALPPDYRPEVGKLWLERGGVYAQANIRGGGEFGPAWHQAALKANRQRAFDDFVAVARDLAARGITEPRRLGIYGRSNGGVLTSVAVTQHPELFNAAVIESPLIDMLRYHELPAGASWIGEYGDPRIPEEAAFVADYSAYQRLRPDVNYPRLYITTNTRDDRVHPGHARKFAARLGDQGHDHLYFEDTAGGHANDADPLANARRWARHYVYLAQQLMD